MIASILAVHTGSWIVDTVVYVVSGGAFVGLCFLLPLWVRDHRWLWYWSWDRIRGWFDIRD